MIGLITLPWMFLAGLMAGGCLVAIYLFRMRYRQYQVSSLMFWLDQFQPITGGRRLEKFRMPFIFLLEMLCIILLCLAAAKPIVQKNEDIQRVIVILDDSVSMRAGGESESPRAKGLKELQLRYPDDGKVYLRYIVAGSSVRTIRVSDRNLEDWKCASPESKIDEAIALAREMDPEAKILVISDHKPKEFEENGRMQWWAFGRPMQNIGFINAARSADGQKDHFLIELIRSNKGIKDTTVEISSGDQIIKKIKVEFDSTISENSKMTKKLVWELPHTSADIKISLPEDSLTDDNVIILLAGSKRPVRIENRLAESPLRKAIEKALDSGPAHKYVKEHADLILTDKAVMSDLSSTWIMQFITGGQTRAYVGPFIVNKVHPLLDGMNFSGIIWAADELAKLGGIPVIMAGNMPLLTDRELRTGEHILSIVFEPEKSNLTTSPNWPILFWNLVSWRAANLPGITEANIRLGGQATLILSNDTKNIEQVKPDGEKEIIPVQNAMLEINADERGIYHLRDSEREYRFAVNLLSRDESSLATVGSGKFGHWSIGTSTTEQYQSLTGLFLLLSLCALVGHHMIIAGNRRGGTA
jgi:hypothetical protein